MSYPPRSPQFLLFFALSMTIAVTAIAIQVDLVRPDNSSSFGADVKVLPNGNIVVTAPNYSIPHASQCGAVFVFGPAGNLISTLTGASENDRVGSNGVTVLTNGNFVVCSPGWKNGAAASAGAVTWGNQHLGVSGEVSADNSLVGISLNDQVGWTSGGRPVTELSNGNYLVRSSMWNNGANIDAGAVTWGDGSRATGGLVSSANSLVGDSDYSSLGDGAITPLSNGNYVVCTNYRNDEGVRISAVTWGNGAIGVGGVVTESNSLVGSLADDAVGYADGANPVTALTNGNYVVSSIQWKNGSATGAGAVTWGDGDVGVSGIVSPENSLVGIDSWEQIGFNGVTALSNGNYVVASSRAQPGGVFRAGAVTWGNGETGISGEISLQNSLVGLENQSLGESVTALTNGNYVVCSPSWINSALIRVGAVTWGNGYTGIVGRVSAENSLVGSGSRDSVGYAGAVALANGNYVVISPEWHGDSEQFALGAVTWCNGTAGGVGMVSPLNSLIGASSGDKVGAFGVTALSNGNYVVCSPKWSRDGLADVGAATWGDGRSGTVGVVSPLNSLVGSAEVDQVGYGVTALSNGNYVVRSPFWKNIATANAGAVTWSDGTRGIRGDVSALNSLVGSSFDDRVGFSSVKAAKDGTYFVISYDFRGCLKIT